MIKELKRTSIKLSTKSVLLGLTILIALLGNSLIVKGTEIDNDSSAFTSNDKINKSNFIIDSPTKFYDDIKKVEKVANMKFKVPDFLPDKNKTNGFEIRKLSDKDNTLVIFFGGTKGDFSFLVSGSNPVEALKIIEDNRTKAIENIKVDSKKEPLKLGDINGLSVTLITTLPARQIGDNYSKESKKISNYYIWKNEGLWYSLEYNSTSKSEENSNVLVNISKEDIMNIVKSLKYPEEVKNVDYSIKENASVEIPVLNIYDMEEFHKAKDLLGFNPKFPLNIGDDIKITGAIVGTSREVNKKNNTLQYELNNFYSNKNGSIIFTARKNSKLYENINKNGFASYENCEDDVTEQTRTEKLNINNIDVFKYGSTGVIPQENYIWKENDIYYSLSIFETISNCDEVVKGFINSNRIE